MSSDSSSRYQEVEMKISSLYVLAAFVAAATAFAIPAADSPVSICIQAAKSAGLSNDDIKLAVARGSTLSDAQEKLARCIMLADNLASSKKIYNLLFLNLLFYRSTNKKTSITIFLSQNTASTLKVTRVQQINTTH